MAKGALDLQREAAAIGQSRLGDGVVEESGMSLTFDLESVWAVRVLSGHRKPFAYKVRRPQDRRATASLSKGLEKLDERLLVGVGERRFAWKILGVSEHVGSKIVSAVTTKSGHLLNLIRSGSTEVNALRT